MKFTAGICLLSTYVGIAAAATGCQVELLNINQAAVGTGCIPFNYYASIYDPNTRAGYTIHATIDCGLSVQSGTRLPDGYSVRRVGFC